MVDEKVKQAVVGDEEENPRTKHPPCNFFTRNMIKENRAEYNFHQKELLLMLRNCCFCPGGKNMNMFCVNAAVPLLASPKLRKSERGGPFKNLSASLSKSFFSKIKVSGI